MDGEFEPAIDRLEHILAEGLLKNHEDSVFAYKHLGVMYAAKYETMEKGKGYMYRLLAIEPSVKILDMYASEMIYMIFRNVQAEYQMRTARIGGSGIPVPLDTAKGKSLPPKDRNRNWQYWTAGTMVVVGAGISAYFLLQDGPAQPNHFKGGF